MEQRLRNLTRTALLCSTPAGYTSRPRCQGLTLGFLGSILPPMKEPDRNRDQKDSRRFREPLEWLLDIAIAAILCIVILVFAAKQVLGL